MDNGDIIESPLLCGRAVLWQSGGDVDVIVFIHRRRIAARIPADDIANPFQRPGNELRRVSKNSRMIRIRKKWHASRRNFVREFQGFPLAFPHILDSQMLFKIVGQYEIVSHLFVLLTCSGTSFSELCGR